MLSAKSTTDDYIRAEHKFHSISKLFISRHHITRRVFCVFFLAYLYSASTQHGNLHPEGWPISFCAPTQEPVLAIANIGKIGRGFGKKCRWMDWKGSNTQGTNPWQSAWVTHPSNGHVKQPSLGRCSASCWCDWIRLTALLSLCGWLGSKHQVPNSCSSACNTVWRNTGWD